MRCPNSSAFPPTSSTLPRIIGMFILIPIGVAHASALFRRWAEGLGDGRAIATSRGPYCRTHAARHVGWRWVPSGPITPDGAH